MLGTGRTDRMCQRLFTVIYWTFTWNQAVSVIQWCHLQLKVTLLFLRTPPFLHVLPLHNPLWIKSSRDLPAYSIHCTCWADIPYLWWIALAAGSIVLQIWRRRPRPSRWSSVLYSHVSFREPLVSFLLAEIMCDFLSAAGLWQDVHCSPLLISFICVSVSKEMCRCVSM